MVQEILQYSIYFCNLLPPPSMAQKSTLFGLKIIGLNKAKVTQ